MSQRQPAPEAGVEVLTEPVTGWRAWRLTLDDEGRPRLSSPIHEWHVWPVREATVAECPLGLHEGASSLSCGCGLYAFAYPEGWLARGVDELHTVVGQVSMWGTVCEHEFGYRSQFAYPARLRLVCSQCVQTGAGRWKPDYVVPAGTTMKAVCSAHLGTDASEPLGSAEQMEQELLSAYAVEMLPDEMAARVNPMADLPGFMTHVATRTRPASAPTRPVRRRSVWSGIGSILLWSFLIVWWLASSVHGVRASDPAAPVAHPSTAAASAVGSRDGVALASEKQLLGVPRVAVVGPLPHLIQIPPMHVLMTGKQKGRFAFTCAKVTGSRVHRVACGSKNADVFIDRVRPRGTGPVITCGEDVPLVTRVGAHMLCWARVGSAGTP